jgi:hypothetical protein
MMKTRLTLKMALALAVLVVLTAGSIAVAGKKPPPGPGPGPGTCPKDILCADVWNPVTCANGITYSNQCYADRACAPGPCTPAGGGPI